MIRYRWWAGLVLAGVLSHASAVPNTRVLDDFKNPALWLAQASDSVTARVENGGAQGTCLAYDFGKVSGYAVMRRALPLVMPEHYALTLKWSGQGQPNHLQFKLVDASGDNVWWLNKPNTTPPAQPQLLTIRQRQIEFAWGPTTDKQLRQAAAIELVVASGQGGGAGRWCFQSLALQTLPPPTPVAPPVLRQTPQGSVLDLGQPLELNGLLWQWAQPAGPHSAQVQTSTDGRHWATVHRIVASRRTWQALWLPEHEARFVRITGPQRVAQLQAPSPALWPDRNAMFKALAAQAPRSHYPRALAGEQNYWTVVGTDAGGRHAALVSEDGAIEPQRAGPSIEPFILNAQGQALGWADVKTSQHLPEGDLPMPQVRWQHDSFSLALDTAAVGDARNSHLLARYTVRNASDQPQALTLALMLRPWQVNPPQQFLNTPGGFAPVRDLAWQGRTLSVNGQPCLQALQAPQAVTAAAFDVADPLASPSEALTRLQDPNEAASARLDWPLQLAPGQSQTITLSLPLAGHSAAPQDQAQADAQFKQVAQAWHARLNRVTFELPGSAQPIAHSLRSALAHILMQRDGPALQPGTRSYARSWVRDGAMMVTGLLRLGEVQAARDFVHWYAGHLFANGKVPCCVDARGADPVAENDSHGQFIYAVAELWRRTHDRTELQQLWPQVDAAARYMETLRQSERVAANRQPGREAFWGLMPASISHEGYSAKPMHSHWDNLWALAGWRDAQAMAAELGLTERAAQLQQQHDEFKRELGQSMATTLAQHRLQTLPASAELADFDPTSSTMIFSPAGAEHLVPAAVLRNTWQRYWDESVARRLGQREWKDYTPYELRSVSALARLGEGARARAMLDFFFADQRPAGWNQWAEVVWNGYRRIGFIGDMPHAWISSDYIRSALDLLAYERDSDQALVLAAGVDPRWLANGQRVGVQGLVTPWGPLGYRLQQDGADLVLSLTPGLSDPPGGVWLQWQGQLHRVPAGQSTLRLTASLAP